MTNVFWFGPITLLVVVIWRMATALGRNRVHLALILVFKDGTACHCGMTDLIN
jgi:hypothetical protein